MTAARDPNSRAVREDVATARYRTGVANWAFLFLFAHAGGLPRCCRNPLHDPATGPRNTTTIVRFPGTWLVADPTGGTAPASLNFNPAGGLGLNFTSLSPVIGQVFYIGDGVTGGGDFQTFIAPTGATRVYLGIPDGFGITGPPGAYDDNDGSYRVLIGVNEIPTLVSAPPTTVLTLLGLMAVAWRRGTARGCAARDAVQTS